MDQYQCVWSLLHCQILVSLSFQVKVCGAAFDLHLASMNGLYSVSLVFRESIYPD